MNIKSKRTPDKKQTNFKTPNLSKMQEVIIDRKTSIFIELGADPEIARSRYLARLGAR